MERHNALVKLHFTSFDPKLDAMQSREFGNFRAENST